MKRTITISLCLLAFNGAFSQVKSGVNTTSPQQTLHVTGSPSTTTTIGDGSVGRNLVTPTLRIDGLSQSNNTAHGSVIPTTSVLPLYATTSGDLVVGKRFMPIISSPPGIDGLPLGSNGVLLNTPTGTLTSVSLLTKSFTLTRPSIVYFNASVSIGSIQPSGTSLSTTPKPSFSDDIAKKMGIEFWFTAAGTSGIPTTSPFASSTDSYVTGLHSKDIPFGFYWYSLSKEMVLPAGNYTFQITATAEASASFQCYVGGGYDTLNIIAIAL